MRKLLLFLFPLLALLFPSPSWAGSLLRDVRSGQLAPAPYQGWIQNSQIPSPSELIDFAPLACPSPGYESAWGCAITQGSSSVLYLHPEGGDLSDRQDTLRHELGHRFGNLLSAQEQARWASLVGRPGAPWRDQQDNTVNEQFAVAYSLAARYSARAYARDFSWPRKRVRSRAGKRILVPDYRWSGVRWEHGFRANPRQFRRVIRFIESSALAHGWSR